MRPKDLYSLEPGRDTIKGLMPIGKIGEAGELDQEAGVGVAHAAADLLALNFLPRRVLEA
jgi:hypothetical protein